MNINRLDSTWTEHALSLTFLTFLRHDDVANAGNLDDDTPEVDAPEFDPANTSPLAEADREARKMPRRTKALLQRYGGHPYDNYDMLPPGVRQSDATAASDVLIGGRTFSSLLTLAPTPPRPPCHL